jgi:hypothetical protein
LQLMDLARALPLLNWGMAETADDAAGFLYCGGHTLPTVWIWEMLLFAKCFKALH